MTFSRSGEDFGRHAPSYYAATAPACPEARPLAATESADVCIVGGGFAGLGAALALARAGNAVRLVEAGPLGWGASGRNGGQVHMGWNQDQLWLERKFGLPTARALWDVALAPRENLDGLLPLDPDQSAFPAGHVHAHHPPRFLPGTHAHAATSPQA